MASTRWTGSRRSILLRSIVVTALLGATSAARGVHQYVGPPGGAWLVPTHWDAGTLPDAATDVLLSTSVVVSGPGAEARSVTVALDGCLMLTTGTLAVTEAVVVQDGGCLVETEGNLVAGLLDVQAGGTMALLDPPAMMQSDSIMLDPAAATFWLGGTVNLLGGTWQHWGPTVQLDADDAVAGAGMIEAALVNGGSVDPGLPLGALTINGAYTQQAAGLLAIELGEGPAGPEHDLLIVNEAAVLGGTLLLSSIDGFAPEPGAEFVILTAASVEGTFATVDVTGSLAEVDLGLVYGPDSVTLAVAGEPDADGDGVPDSMDGCPNDPDKIFPGDCGCGVPDTDSDGDGVADCNDGCPDDPDKNDPGDCGCGVPDTDSDGDGVADCNDGCPDDPDKNDPGDCGCGVPDADSDGDGVADCNDLCPDDPDKNDPGDCGCGVPDTDSDGDGVADCNDGCPDDPDKNDPGDCGCGVPDADSDGDGVADCNDGCPDDPDKNDPGDCGCGVPDTDSDGDGVADCNDGCPDDPDKNDPGDCGCGVPDSDSDGDGVADCNDGCPDDPDKNDPGDCGCGVPDTDSDGDGVADCNDPCPDDPQDSCLPQACCLTDGTCQMLEPSACLDAGGTPQGAGNDCAGASCPQPPPCPADITGDGWVNVDDLVEVILAWNLGESPADIDGSGVVDVDDLTLLIVAWGPCGGVEP